MSTALGVAAVTHVLKDLLNDELIKRNVSHVLGNNLLVSSLCPGQIDAKGATDSQLNLFLYRVSPNTGWNNLGYPSRNARGELINNPPLALNLHYLLSAFGENELHAEILLGYGMQLLHENPVLTRGAIRRSLMPSIDVTGEGLSDHLRNLSESGLADQFEQVTITPEPIHIEDISRLWTAFQTRYRPCTAYLVTVVLIESDRSTKPALPVRERRVYALPFRHPVIEKILSEAAGAPTPAILEHRRIESGDRLILRGRQLKSDGVLVRISGQDYDLEAKNVSETEVSLILPSGLKAGPHGVQIIQPLRLDWPVELEQASPGAIPSIKYDFNQRQEVSTNLLTFVLSPKLSQHDSNSTQMDTSTGSESLYKVDIKLKLQPPLYQRQKVVVLLNQINPDTGEAPRAYSGTLPPRVLSEQSEEPLPRAEVTIPVTGVRSGKYLLRVQVDGADTALTLGADGTFSEPSITVQ